jgi:hypothetical protein
MKILKQFQFNNQKQKRHLPLKHELRTKYIRTTFFLQQSKKGIDLLK